MFSKLDIMVSRGRSLIGRAGVLTKWPSPIVPKFPSRGNFGDDGHVALGNESGFPKFPQNKIFRWRLCIWQSSPCLALLSKKSVFKMICRIWTLWFKIENCDIWVLRTVVAQYRTRTGGGTRTPFPGMRSGTSTTVLLITYIYIERVSLDTQWMVQIIKVLHEYSRSPFKTKHVKT